MYRVGYLLPIIVIQFAISYSYQIFLNVIFRADFIDRSCGRKNKL